MVNRGGLKVFPGEVEEVLRTAPGVDDVAVVGAPDDRLGEVPGRVRRRRRRRGSARGALPCAPRPVQGAGAVRALDELPRNEVGKVLTRELSARA